MAHYHTRGKGGQRKSRGENEQQRWKQRGDVPKLKRKIVQSEQRSRRLLLQTPRGDDRSSSNSGTGRPAQRPANKLMQLMRRQDLCLTWLQILVAITTPT